MQTENIEINKNRRIRFIVRILGGGLGFICLLAVWIVVLARVGTCFSNRITTENGVDEGIYVSLAGQEQYLLIRGEDVDNPVIIWLHGGPASADGFANYVFEKELLKDYTIINWDQRGCGRTYYHNLEQDSANQTATFEQAKLDLGELIDYACERFQKDGVILVGHSYGTMLGSAYVLENPTKVLAYVGVGQFVNIESDTYSYQDALEKAKAAGDDTAEMEAAFAEYEVTGTLTAMMRVRSFATKYHPAEKNGNTLWTGIRSPYMGWDDLRWFLRQMGSLEDYFELNRSLFDSIMTTDVREFGTEYRIPVGFCSGADDWTTPVKYAQDYYEMITAPKKLFTLVEGCGHSPQMDDPSAFSKELKGMLEELLTE